MENEINEKGTAFKVNVSIRRKNDIVNGTDDFSFIENNCSESVIKEVFKKLHNSAKAKLAHLEKEYRNLK